MNEVIRDIFKKELDEKKQEGIHEGIETDRQRVARDMLKDKKPLAEIKKYSQLAEDVIRNLAVSLGVSVI